MADEAAQRATGHPPDSSRVRRFIGSFWPAVSGGTPASPDEQREFQRYVGYSVQLHGPRLLVLLALVVVLAWPLDPLLLSGDTAALSAFAWLRFHALGVLLVGAWLAPKTPWFQRHPDAVLAAFALTAAGGAAYWLGSIEGFNGRWFIYLAVLPLLAVPFASSGFFRWPTLAALFAVLWGGFALGAPTGTTRPHELAVGVSFLAFTTALAGALGQVVFSSSRDAFVSRIRLARQEEVLRDLNENLEGRVAEKALALRRLARHLERLREDERKWMAREIHDELGQELTALRYAVALARLSMGAEAAGSLNDVQELLDRTRTTMRRILAALRPRVLDELGLVAGLEWLAKDLSSRATLEIQLEVEPPDLQLEGDGATVVFRIVQEALSNVLKHAEAGRAWVRLSVEAGTLVLIVADDGRGLPPEGDGRAADVQPGHGLGVLGIRERADAIGGSASLRARREGGTELRVVVPYPIFPAEGEVIP